MLKGYEEAEETFKLWTAKGTLTDFKPAKRVDIGAFRLWHKVAEGANTPTAPSATAAKPSSWPPTARCSASPSSHHQRRPGCVPKIPMRMGRAAIRTVGSLVYAVLTGNPNMSDGAALFHASHNNPC